MAYGTKWMRRSRQAVGSDTHGSSAAHCQPERNGGAQRVLSRKARIGKPSFGGLPGRRRTVDTIRPSRTLGPVLGKPEHGLLEGLRFHIADTFGNSLKRRTSVEDDRRNTLTPDPSGTAVGV